MSTEYENIVKLKGYIGNKPKLLKTLNNKTVLTVQLSTKASWALENGKRKEKTSWHRAVFWGSLAKAAMSANISEGSQIEIIGHIEYNDYIKGDKTYHNTDIIIEKFTIL